ASCGACGAACSQNNINASCGGGQCSGSCFAGFADCNGDKRSDGCETNVGSNVLACGGCNLACSTNHVNRACDAGACDGQCAAGCSTNHITATCGAGTCNGSCVAGWADCNGNKLSDGCEQDVGGDVLNCGGCGAACSTSHVTRSCSGGSCEGGACDPGFADCN